jgi:hypothetical protein
MFHLLTAANTRERMAEIGRFIEFWYGPRRTEYGEPDVDELYPYLPEALKLFYSFAGQWPPPGGARFEGDFFYGGNGGHHLLPAKDVTLTESGRLRFFMEYQGDWDGLTSEGESDPPVWIDGSWDLPTRGKGVRKVATALSKFLATHVLMTTLYDDLNSPSPRPRTHAGDIKLADWFQRSRGQSEHIWEAEPNGCAHYEGSFFLVKEHVLLHQTGSHHQFGAIHPEGIEILRNAIGDS